MNNDETDTEQLTNDEMCDAFHSQPLGTVYVKFKKLSGYINGPNAPAHEGDCGSDCFATETITLKPNTRFNMPLGIALEFNKTHFCLVQAKSGLAKKFGITTIGNVIDSSYRGEIHAQIVNTSNEWVKIDSGMKICQLLFVPISIPWFNEVEKLNESTRGYKGFGSTGK